MVVCVLNNGHCELSLYKYMHIVFYCDVTCTTELTFQTGFFKKNTHFSSPLG